MRILSTVLLLVVTAVASPAISEEKHEVFDANAHATLSAFRGMVEEHIQGVQRSLRVLANSAEARSGRTDEFKPLLVRLSEDLPTDATAWFVFPDGSYFATEEAGMTDKNLKDRTYFPALMAGKQVLGDLVVSKSTGHRSVIVAEPVLKNGTVVGAVGVSLRVRLLSDLVNKHMPLPDDWYFYALERDTRIALHRKAERMFQTPADVGDEELEAEFKRALQQPTGRFDYTLRGRKIVTMYELSPELGWYFFLARDVTGS